MPDPEKKAKSDPIRRIAFEPRPPATGKVKREAEFIDRRKEFLNRRQEIYEHERDSQDKFNENEARDDLGRMMLDESGKYGFWDRAAAAYHAQQISKRNAFNKTFSEKDQKEWLDYLKAQNFDQETGKPLPIEEQRVPTFPYGGGFEYDQFGNAVKYSSPATVVSAPDPNARQKDFSEPTVAPYWSPLSPLGLDEESVNRVEILRQTGLDRKADSLLRKMTARAMGVDPWYVREDGTPKGPGWRGSWTAPDGKEVTEMSITAVIDGQEVPIPSIVPETTDEEAKAIAAGNIPESARIKAILHAVDRIREGKSPYKEMSEEQIRAKVRRANEGRPRNGQGSGR